jgi:hypothetical protein
MFIGIGSKIVELTTLPGPSRPGNNPTPGPPPVTSYNILAQNGDTLILQNGDSMVTEAAP